MHCRCATAERRGATLPVVSLVQVHLKRGSSWENSVQATNLFRSLFYMQNNVGIDHALRIVHTQGTWRSAQRYSCIMTHDSFFLAPRAHAVSRGELNDVVPDNSAMASSGVLQEAYQLNVNISKSRVRAVPNVSTRQFITHQFKIVRRWLEIAQNPSAWKR